MLIFVKNSTGNPLTLSVDPFDTVESLFAKIQDREVTSDCSIPVAQRLTFTGKQLDAGHSLSEYNIQQGSTLDLAVARYPKHILNMALELFNDQETVGSEYYSLYLMILSYWFPPQEGYAVSPHWTIPDAKKGGNSNITFVVERRRHPLLLVEVKPPSDFHTNSGREGAINQIIDRLDEIGPTNQHFDRLYAISAIGKRWRARYALKGVGSKSIAQTTFLRSAAQECWNDDITSEASCVAMGKIVVYIKGLVSLRQGQREV